MRPLMLPVNSWAGDTPAKGINTAMMHSVWTSFISTPQRGLKSSRNYPPQSFRTNSRESLPGTCTRHYDPASLIWFSIGFVGYPLTKAAIELSRSNLREFDRHFKRLLCGSECFPASKIGRAHV